MNFDLIVNAINGQIRELKGPLQPAIFNEKVRLLENYVQLVDPNQEQKVIFDAGRK